MDKAQVEKIVRKNFQGINKEGLGFLESSINQCVEDIIEALKNEAAKTKKMTDIQGVREVLNPIATALKDHGIKYHFDADANGGHIEFKLKHNKVIVFRENDQFFVIYNQTMDEMLDKVESIHEFISFLNK